MKVKMIIDFHCHVGKHKNGYESLSFEELKKSMDKWGIDKSVVFAFHNTKESMIRQSLDILEKSKECDWVIPFVRFDPKETSKEELKEWLDMGFKGVKLHPHMENFDPLDSQYFWVYEICKERNIPVLLHAGKQNDFCDPIKIFGVAKRFPDLKVILAHFFVSDYEISEAKNYPNFYVDTSIRSGSLKRNHIINREGFKNLLFASDAPYDSPGVALLKIREAGLDKEDEDMILSGNAMEVLG